MKQRSSSYSPFVQMTAAASKRRVHIPGSRDNASMNAERCSSLKVENSDRRDSRSHVSRGGVGTTAPAASTMDSAYSSPRQLSTLSCQKAGKSYCRNRSLKPGDTSRPALPFRSELKGSGQTSSGFGGLLAISATRGLYWSILT